jgi:hypothetical protein
MTTIYLEDEQSRRTESMTRDASRPLRKLKSTSLKKVGICINLINLEREFTKAKKPLHTQTSPYFRASRR